MLASVGSFCGGPARCAALHRQTPPFSNAAEDRRLRRLQLGDLGHQQVVEAGVGRALMQLGRRGGGSGDASNFAAVRLPTRLRARARVSTALRRLVGELRDADADHTRASLPRRGQGPHSRPRVSPRWRRSAPSPSSRTFERGVQTPRNLEERRVERRQLELAHLHRHHRWACRRRRRSSSSR